MKKVILGIIDDIDTDPDDPGKKAITVDCFFQKVEIIIPGSDFRPSIGDKVKIEIGENE